MSTRICPVCGADYLDWVESCSTCGVALVAPSEAPDPLRLPEDQQVVYEIGAWPLGLQAEAAQAMAESGIPHGWTGTDLVVQVDNEERVDALLDAVEVGEDPFDEDGAVRPRSNIVLPADTEGEDDDGPEAITTIDGDELEYDLDEWSEPDRLRLDRFLRDAGLAHRWEPDDLLVVAAADEDVVEQLMDRVEYPDALTVEEPGEEDDGDGGFEVMSDLFVAADRLKGNPRDPDGIEGLATAVATADVHRPPYGVEPELWQLVVLAANELADRLAGKDDDDGEDEPDDEVDEAGAAGDGVEVGVASDGGVAALLADDDADDVAGEDEDDDDPGMAGDVTRRAAALRDLLRPYV